MALTCTRGHLWELDSVGKSWRITLHTLYPCCSCSSSIRRLKDDPIVIISLYLQSSLRDNFIFVLICFSSNWFKPIVKVIFTCSQTSRKLFVCWTRSWSHWSTIVSFHIFSDPYPIYCGLLASLHVTIHSGNCTCSVVVNLTQWLGVIPSRHCLLICSCLPHLSSCLLVSLITK